MIDTISYVKNILCLYPIFDDFLILATDMDIIFPHISRWVFPRCRRHKRFVPAELLRHRVAAGAQQTQHVQATLLHLRILEGMG